MGFSLRNKRPYSIAGVGMMMLALAACQSGEGADAVALNAATGSQPAAAPVRESDLRAFCPTVRLQQGTASFNTYQGRAKDDASKLVYQASISDVTRACTYGDGSITMNVAVAGRVVPGPAGRAGQITMPIRIVVLNGSEVVYSKLHRHPVAVQDTLGATQFVFNDPAVTVPAPTGSTMVVLAGYDEGPYDAR